MSFHVFSMGPMCSLRRTLLLWLVPLFLLVGSASAAFSYWCHGRMVNAFMDGQMQQLGESIALNDRQVMLSPPSNERMQKWGAYAVQVYGTNGGLQLASWPQLTAGLQESLGFHDVDLQGKPWRVYATASKDPRMLRVQIFQSGEFRRRLAAEQALTSIMPVLILLPLAIFILWGVARAVSLGVQDISRQAALQSLDTTSELPLERVPQEIRPLVVSFNNLLARMRDAFATRRRFVQDAAHELRTPLTAIALQLENLRCDLPNGACAQSFAQLEAGISRAQRLVDQLLKLSRLDAPVVDAASAVDVRAQLHESVSGLIALADQRRIDLGLVDEPHAPLPSLRCVPGDLRSVLDNLIENALRYTPEGGVVDVRLVAQGGRPAVEVIDTGPGIPPDLLARVFDRFYRVADSQVRGSGLGLSIAQAAAQRCGMRVLLRNRDDRSGLVARIEPA